MTEAYLVMAPIVAALLIGTLVQLEDLGQDAADRTVAYAEDAVAALDCAYEARAITECAPGIINEDFSEEIRRTQELLDQLDEGLAKSTN